MSNKPAQKPRSPDKAPMPEVTRWAALVVQEITARRDEFAAAAPAWPLTLICAVVLAIVRQESGGNPEAVAGGTGAGGLTQLHPKWYDAALLFDPVANIRTCISVLLDFLRKNGGRLPEAVFSRGWGDGNFSAWMKDEGDDEHAAYVHHLFAHTAPLYGRWLVGWIEAGKPAKSGTVESKGKNYTLALAVHKHGGRELDLSSPYDGTFAAHGTTRTYKPTPTLAGVMPDLGALAEVVSDNKGGVAAVLVGLFVAGAALLSRRAPRITPRRRR